MRWSFCRSWTPHRLDLLHSVTAESAEPLPPGGDIASETLMRSLILPWRKGPFSSTGEYQY